MLSYNITNWLESPGPREAHVVVTARTRSADFVLGLCDELDELPTPRMRHVLGGVVRRLGKSHVERLAGRAKIIFAGSGMLVRDGSRRRTLGGVFFQLIKRERRQGMARHNPCPPPQNGGTQATVGSA
jgi:hypothetical protein